MAEILTDFPERFAERKRVFLLDAKYDPRPMDLEDHWLHKGRIVLKFAGIDSIEAAETLRNIEVAIPRAERAPLEDGAIYIDDLIGSTLIDSRAGMEVGKIVEVDRESTATALLVVKTPAMQEVLVPFVKVFQPEFDINARTLKMKLPDGLLELNNSGTVESKSKMEAESDAG
jgi:16S rRNA processing protein RimM